MTDHTDAYVSKGQLSPANIKYYQDYGFLIAEQLLTAAEVADLKAETAEIFRGNRGEVAGMVDVKGLSDEEVLKHYIAIHFPHKLSGLIRDYLKHPKILAILTGIVSPNLKCMQSMLFVKAPGKAGQSWHQDEFYIPTRDKSLVGAWIAIDDATVENGCLWIIPGSNHPGYMHKRVPSESTEYADVDTVDISGYAGQTVIPVPVSKGSVVFFNGYTLHSSKRNKTEHCFRTALVNHYMSAESMLPWDQDGSLEPTEDLRDIIMVAGEDPYGYKGTIDVNKPFLRPEVLRIKTDL